METKRLIRRIITACVLLMAVTACTVDEGESRPRKTQGEYSVFNWVYVQNVVAAREIYTTFGFDQYLRQTTEAGRLTVRDRFFPYMHISGSGTNWSLSREGMRYDFELDTENLLDVPGAHWKVYYWHESSNTKQLVGEYTSEQDRVRCKVYSDMAAAEWVTDWTIDVKITDDDFCLTADGSGEFRFNSGFGKELWMVAYTISEPLEWHPTGMVIGTVEVSARLSGGESRLLEFEAVQLGPDGVRIIAGDDSEEWYW